MNFCAFLGARMFSEFASLGGNNYVQFAKAEGHEWSAQKAFLRHPLFAKLSGLTFLQACTK
jgi:hypothetical protein